MPIVLESAALRAQIEPGRGGGLVRFDWIGDGVCSPLMRPCDASAAGDADPNTLACYPLVPWSNRISNGGFMFDGCRVAVARNRDDEPWPIHGSGWQRAWRVARRGASEVVLALDDSSSSAHRYHAQLRYGLAGDALDITLSVTNSGAEARPFGVGLHPFFLRDAHTRLLAPAREVWLGEGGSPLPQARARPPQSWDFAQDRELTDGLDHGFDGWNGRATIRWPQRRLRLELRAEATRYVVYTPAGAPFFCFEPVDHAINAVNLEGGAEAHGMTRLARGETLTRRYQLRAAADVEDRADA